MTRGQRKLVFVLSMIGVIGFAIYAALQFGEKSPLIAGGSVELSSELTEQAKDITTLFIIVKDANNPRPMPIGAARTSIHPGAKGSFYNFVLTKEFLQLMVAESSLPQTLTIKARLDVDGAGGADTPGDIVGEVTGVQLGSSGVQIKLDRVIQ